MVRLLGPLLVVVAACAISAVLVPAPMMRRTRGPAPVYGVGPIAPPLSAPAGPAGHATVSFRIVSRTAQPPPAAGDGPSASRVGSTTLDHA